MANEHDRGETVSTGDRKTLLTGFVIARNAAAIRAFVEAEGMSRDELKGILRQVIEDQEEVGTEIRLGARYDIHTARYSTLGEFVERLVREG